jgi:hypothetical protein
MKWYPVGISYPFGHPMVKLAAYPESIFKAPFLTFGIRDYEKEFGKPQIKIMHIDEYKTYLQEQVIVPPTGFIFHPSKSGSTLVGQMLAELDNCRVVSEPSIPNIFYQESMINRNQRFDKEELKLLILGLFIKDEQLIQHTFIKFSSWMIDLLPIIQEIFPNTPWLYVYRNPIEIMVSAINKPSELSALNKRKPKALIRQINKTEDEIRELSEECFSAKLIAYNFKLIIQEYSNPNGKIVEYSEIKTRFDAILKHFKIKTSVEEWKRIQERSQYYSKSSRSIVFKSDVGQKLKEVTSTIKLVVEQEKLDKLYSQLVQKDSNT